MARATCGAICGGLENCRSQPFWRLLSQLGLNITGRGVAERLAGRRKRAPPGSVAGTTNWFT